MNPAAVAFAAAAWLGILTSISPCPLATNIAAVSYLARRAGSRRSAVVGALAYSFGRAAAYLLIGAGVAAGLASAPALSSALQNNIAPFVGPLLIVVALMLLGWISLPVDFSAGGAAAGERLARMGWLGELLLGMLFALSFCPVSAALFFGALLPMALARPFALPLFAVYGIGTALPVAVIAVLVAVGAASSRKVLDWLARTQGTLKTGTAIVILGVGLWLTLSSSMGLF
jgi:cytochrome c-type biogenesis protein